MAGTRLSELLKDAGAKTKAAAKAKDAAAQDFQRFSKGSPTAGATKIRESSSVASSSTVHSKGKRKAGKKLPTLVEPEINDLVSSHKRHIENVALQNAVFQASDNGSLSNDPQFVATPEKHLWDHAELSPGPSVFPRPNYPEAQAELALDNDLHYDYSEPLGPGTPTAAPHCLSPPNSRYLPQGDFFATLKMLSDQYTSESEPGRVALVKEEEEDWVIAAANSIIDGIRQQRQDIAHAKKLVERMEVQVNSLSAICMTEQSLDSRLPAYLAAWVPVPRGKGEWQDHDGVYEHTRTEGGGGIKMKRWRTEDEDEDERERQRRKF